MGGDSVAHLVPEFSNLLVTRTFSKTESLAGLRVGYAILPEMLADDLNNSNDAYPLTRPSQAAALATLQNEEKIRHRVVMLRDWTQQLSEALQRLGVRTFPTDGYFFLADFAPHDAEILSMHLKKRNILIRPLNDKRLGPGYMRITTSLPEANARFLAALKELL
jgi:histidinol-phosphate aminotransferase